MKNTTRAMFNGYCSAIALANSVPDATAQFNVAPEPEQKLEAAIANTSEFLGEINIMPVTQQEAQVLGIGVTRSIAGRTDTSGNNRRHPTAAGGANQKHRYLCKQTNFDWSQSYAVLDAWRHDPNFERLLRDDIVRQIALDRQMIGFHGVEAAAQTDRVANPKLEDVNEGWLHKIRTDAPSQVMDDGALTIDNTGAELVEKGIYIKPGVELYDAELGNEQDAAADYASLDALVIDASRGIHEAVADDNDLVVIVGRNLMDDKYFTIAQTTGATATEVEATDRIIRSSKMIGGKQAMRVTGFPADGLLITKLSNLSIYWQEETRRRKLKDEDEYDRVANYESVNEAYVVEDYEAAVLVENIKVGAAPPRPAP